MFVKPANLGSSVGIRKVSSAGQFEDTIELAFAYDTKIILGHAISGREIECAVLGSDDPIVPWPYSYQHVSKITVGVWNWVSGTG